MVVRFREYRGQHVRFRPNDTAEDRVALIPDLGYRPDELNLYSEVDPLHENVPPLRGPSALRYVVTHHRRELFTEILPAAPALVYMETLQDRVGAYVVNKCAGSRADPVRLKKEIKDYAASLGFALCGVTLLDRRFVVDGFDDRRRGALRAPGIRSCANRDSGRPQAAPTRWSSAPTRGDAPRRDTPDATLVIHTRSVARGCAMSHHG